MCSTKAKVAFSMNINWEMSVRCPLTTAVYRACPLTYFEFGVRNRQVPGEINSISPGIQRYRS